MVSQRSTRRDQADRRREQLLEIGLRLFAERGFGATTIADIAGEAGVAHGLVYHYFASKDALLSAVLERFSFLPELGQIMDVAPGRPATEILPAIAARFSAMIGRRADLLGLVVRESRTNPEVASALGEVADAGLALLTNYLTERVDAGELRPHDVTVTARALFYAVVASHLAGAPPPEFPIKLADLVLRGVLAAPDLPQGETG